MKFAIFIAILILLLISMYGMLTKKNIIKLIICFNIMESTLLIFLLMIGFKKGGSYPIIQAGENIKYVNPLPQALALTGIVIGASTTAIMLAFAIKIYKRYGTLNIDEIRRLRG